MFGIIKERLRQGYRTLNWPKEQPKLSPRYLGRPELFDANCGNCTACLDCCPTGALQRRADAPGRTPLLDMGRCIFCGACRQACHDGLISFSQDYQLAARTRGELICIPQAKNQTSPERKNPPGNPAAQLFKRSLKLRQVSAGGCNACEADSNVLGTLVYDLGRFGIEFTASPRHADALVFTGPVSANMRAALLATWAAIPRPRLLVAVGACAISGGLFRPSLDCEKGCDGLCPDVPQAPDIARDNSQEASAEHLPWPDILIPGCPPNPWSILDGLLRLRG